MAERTKTISFRLPSEFANELRAQADGSGVSPGEHARRIVIDALTSQHREELIEIKDSLGKLREDVATAVAVLLVKAGKSDAHEAEEWVRRNLRV